MKNIFDELDKYNDEITDIEVINIILDNLNDYKEFVDLEYFIKRLDSSNKNTFETNSTLVSENFLNKDDILIHKDTFLSFLEKLEDFIIIEWYYYLYKI